MTNNPTLLCIPDISGFTQFMSEVDYNLASVVIPSLLNEIIYANTIGLKVAEIEGDAIFFYKQGDLPTFKQLMNQCFSFHRDFYQRLSTLKKQYENNEHANKIPEILGLKIILHYSENVGLTQIGNRIKLLGEDVIIAHKLLKNGIREDEYLLVTEALLDKYKKEFDDDVALTSFFENNKEYYEHIEHVNYKYLVFPKS